MAERRAWLGLGLGLTGARAAANLLVCMITQRVLGWQSDDDDDYYYYYYLMGVRLLRRVAPALST